MGLQLTATATFERKVYRKSKNGTVSEVEIGPQEYTIVKDGEKRVRLTGYAPPFEMDGKYGMQTKTRVEFLILEPQKYARQRFDSLVTLKVGPTSGLGKIIAAARNAPIEVGESIDLDDSLNQELYVVTEQSESNDRTYVNVTACRPLDGDEDEDDDNHESAKPFPPKAKAKATPADDDDEDEPPY